MIFKYKSKEFNVFWLSFKPNFYSIAYFDSTMPFDFGGYCCYDRN